MTRLIRRAPHAGLVLAAALLPGCGSHAGRPLQAELTARCPQTIRVGDRPAVSVHVTNTEKRAWPVVFLAARAEGRLALTGSSQAHPRRTLARAPGGLLRGSRQLAPRETREYRFAFVARKPGGGDIHVYVWGAPSARRVPTGASSIDCPVGVYRRHRPATVAERRAGTRQFHGPGDARSQFIVGRAVGTLVVRHDSILRWSAAGQGAGVFFSLSGDGLSVGSQAARGSTRTGGSRLLPAGVYRNVQIRAVGSWSAVITPL